MKNFFKKENQRLKNNIHEEGNFKIYKIIYNWKFLNLQLNNKKIKNEILTIILILFKKLKWKINFK